MNRFLRPALRVSLLITAAAGASTAFAASGLSGGDFETQAASVSSFCYFGSCPLGSWTGSGAGLQHEANGAWPGTATPDGTHYGFVQQTGALSQTFVAAQSGLFRLNWLDAGRPNFSFTGNQSYAVSLTGGTGLQSLYSGATTSFQPFTARTATSLASLVVGSSYTLTFQGFSVGDNTAFIDAVDFAFVGPNPGGVPEPASWALMIAGFGLTGAAMRRTQRVRFTHA